MEFFTRFKNEFVLVAVLLAQTVALAVQVRRAPNASGADPRPVRLLRLWAASVVTPVGRATHFFSGGVRGGWSNYVALWQVRQQNEDLKAQLAAIRLQQASEAEDVIQGQRLQALLGFREHYVTSTVAAQVIGTSGSDQSRMLLLDKGMADGLRPDMPVITPDGIVGKLRDVFPHSAQLLLISDQSAGAGVILESTRIRAILKGTASGRVQIGNLTSDSRIHAGERVLTSGGDQVFPRGLPVGVVESIAPDPERQPYTAITVKPAAQLNQLEEVLVITGTQPELPPAAAQDLVDAQVRHQADVALSKAAGAAAAANAPRGLDLSGEQPKESLAQDAAAPVKVDAPPAENAPTNLVPKALPALHPDRYSPGGTPSAADLTPGATVPHRGAPPASPEPTQPGNQRSSTPKRPPAARSDAPSAPSSSSPSLSQEPPH